MLFLKICIKSNIDKKMLSNACKLLIYMHNALEIELYVLKIMLENVATNKNNKRENNSSLFQNKEYFGYVNLYRAIISQALSDLQSRSLQKKFIRSKMKSRAYFLSNTKDLKLICHLADVDYDEVVKIAKAIMTY